MQSKLEKLAASWGVSEGEVLELLREGGMAPWNIYKIAESSGHLSVKKLTEMTGKGAPKDAINHILNNSEKFTGKATDSAAHWQKTLGVKKSFGKRLLSGIGEAAPGTIMTVAGTGALLGGMAIARKVKAGKNEKEREESYKKMIERHPDLSDHPEARVKEYHASLHKFSPTIANDPHLSGSWIKSHLRYSDEGIPVSSLKDVADVHGKHESNSSDDLSKLIGIAGVSKSFTGGNRGSK